MSFTGQNLSIIAGGRAILDNVSLSLQPGEVVAVVGPNGAGKSTLLRTLSDDAPPAKGVVSLNGRNNDAWSPDERALQRAVLPQSPSLAFPFRAFDVVELGRYPHRGRASAEEHASSITAAMEAADVSTLATRDCRTLSGGELHRVHFARALAQVWAPLADGRARFLLLDEPTASLDLAHQGQILSVSRAHARAGCGVLVILHDLNLAAAFADRLIVMSEGHIAAEGCPNKVLTVELIRAVWKTECRIIEGGQGSRPAIIVDYGEASRRAPHPQLRAAE